MSSSENSPDESGYVTGRIRRDDPNHDEYDPSENSHEEDTADSSARSSVPAPPPAAEGTSRGPRLMRTARKRVLPPRRVTLSVPSGPAEEPSQSRSRSQSVAPPPPAIGVPVPRPQGMTALEHAWTSGMANEVELHRHVLDYYRHSIDDILTVLHTHDEFMNRVLEIALDAGVAARRVHTYLEWVIGALVILLGMLIWMMMH